MEHDVLLKQGIKSGNIQLFSGLFQCYYKDLVLYAGRYISSQAACEDIVQNVFLKLWNDRDTIEIEGALRSYLLRSVINQCIDEIRHKNVINEHQKYFLDSMDEGDLSVEKTLLYSDLMEHLDEALKKLPDVLQQAFVMSRMNGMKYGEIAEELGVSVRTVEVRIGKALSQIRISLKDFAGLLLIYLFIK